jgi:hypothetical protein
VDAHVAMPVVVEDPVSTTMEAPIAVVRCILRVARWRLRIGYRVKTLEKYL